MGKYSQIHIHFDFSVMQQEMKGTQPANSPL